jgi:hypothetical protein
MVPSRASSAFDGGREGVFGQALLQRVLRQDAGEQHAFGVGQEVGRGLAVLHHRLADLVQSASVRTPANCAGRSRRGTRPKVS